MQVGGRKKDARNAEGEKREAEEKLLEEFQLHGDSIMDQKTAFRGILAQRV
jgi:hypothetical protein